ncbi:MAG: DUF2997 domain-containing protein [Caulobacteraceae bacterium]|nr:DUF2997 domain-containing protein [Caulobacteraceae bacterium]
MKTVEVTIGPDGAVRVETKGVVGSGCEALSKAIEAAVGTTTDNIRKPEYHHAAGLGAQAKAGAQ